MDPLITFYKDVNNQRIDFSENKSDSENKQNARKITVDERRSNNITVGGTRLDATLGNTPQHQLLNKGQPSIKKMNHAAKPFWWPKSPNRSVTIVQPAR